MIKTVANRAIYASRGIHSKLRVLHFPKPCFQADKSIAGLKPRPGAYSRDVACKHSNTTMQRINPSFNAISATKKIGLQRLKCIFVANIKTNGELYTSKGELAKFHME